MFSRLWNWALGRWYNVPLPTDAGAMPVFQSWYRFNPDSQTWTPFDCEHITAREKGSTEEEFEPAHDSRLVLITWNVDATASAPNARISSIISHLESVIPQVDVIFLQEVSRPALSTLLAIPWLRYHWYLSEVDTIDWGSSQSFKNVTLVSRSRLSTTHLTLGPIWRVNYPSHFRRVALCCDIILPLSKQTQTQSCSASPQSSPNYHPRIRLINVHLDSLPIQPSLRPIQLSTTASYLRAAGHGLVAGDFNPVLPADDTLISNNGLVDAWKKLHPDEDGFTWGIDRNQPFPPNRLDKVAIVAVKAHGIKVVPPGTCMATSNQLKGQEQERQISWSDHSGLLCSFGLECT